MNLTQKHKTLFLSVLMLVIGFCFSSVIHLYKESHERATQVLTMWEKFGPGWDMVPIAMVAPTRHVAMGDETHDEKMDRILNNLQLSRLAALTAHTDKERNLANEFFALMDQQGINRDNFNTVLFSNIEIESKNISHDKVVQRDTLLTKLEKSSELMRIKYASLYQEEFHEIGHYSDYAKTLAGFKHQGKIIATLDKVNICSQWDKVKTSDFMECVKDFPLRLTVDEKKYLI